MQVCQKVGQCSCMSAVFQIEQTHPLMHFSAPAQHRTSTKCMLIVPSSPPLPGLFDTFSPWPRRYSAGRGVDLFSNEFSFLQQSWLKEIPQWLKSTNVDFYKEVSFFAFFLRFFVFFALRFLRVQLAFSGSTRRRCPFSHYVQVQTRLLLELGGPPPPPVGC